jgi:hypothetical protein
MGGSGELVAMWAQGHREDFSLDLWIELLSNLEVRDFPTQTPALIAWVRSLTRCDFLCEFLFFFVKLYGMYEAPWALYYFLNGNKNKPLGNLVFYIYVCI